MLNLDADFSHNPEYIPAILQAAADADVVIGSRYVPGGGVQGWPLHRRLMSRCINLYAKLCLGLKTKDNSGAFRCYSVPNLAEIDWNKTVARGYAFQEEVLYRCRLVGCRFVETPITFEDRRYGVTKINSKEAVSALWQILWLGCGRLTSLFGGRS